MSSSQPIEKRMFYGASPLIFKRAKQLRENMTESEKILWEHLRNKKLNGFRFKPQHPIANYIADFYCHKAGLVVEIDGKSHNNIAQKEYDEGRTYDLAQHGIKVLRFTNDEVNNKVEWVVEEIKKQIEK